MRQRGKMDSVAWYRVKAPAGVDGKRLNADARVHSVNAGVG